MRAAHLADLHLGKRQFSATEGGRNAREADVERAFNLAIDDIIAQQPDLVTIAGDIFDHLRISDYARMVFLRGVQRILEETNAVVIILQGNHEAARTIESLTPIALATLFRDRVHVVCDFKRIRFEVTDNFPTGPQVTCSVACFPFTTRVAEATHRLEPDLDADVNVLLMHAAVRGAADGDTLPYFYGGQGALDIGRAASEWDVVACGDYHEFTRLHPTALAFYSGSIERTSSDIWKEVSPKGWVLTDTVAKTMEFREIPTRPMWDIRFLGPDEVTAPSAEALNAQLDKLANHPDNLQDLAGAIVRLKVEDFPREERDHIDHDLVRKLRGLCLHFQLDISFSVIEAADLGDRRERGVAMSLAAEAAAFFASDPEEVRALVLRALEIEAGVEDLEEVAVA